MISISSNLTKASFTVLGSVLLAIPTTLGAQQSEKKLPCKNNSEQVGECFKIHGRLSAYNGNPSFRIWRIGTTRILGVSDVHPKIRQFPADLENKLDWGIDVFGDFEVCPFTTQTKVAMQFVCVASASNVVVKDLRESSPSINKREIRR